ncbi:MAG: hypothetical protein Q4D17_04045 [Planctomycetia bacterium]|nr:hypothetical protein [Planctomycetia bacterium]
MLDFTKEMIKIKEMTDYLKENLAADISIPSRGADFSFDFIGG